MPPSSLPGCVHVNWIICARIAVSAPSQGTAPTRWDSMCPPPRGGRAQGRVLHAAAGRVPFGDHGEGCSPRTAWTGSGHGHLLVGLVPLWGPGLVTPCM